MLFLKRDVYKRQYEDLVVAMESSVGVESISKPVAGEDSAGAVSYTHLDVYKRQPYGPCTGQYHAGYSYSL